MDEAFLCPREGVFNPTTSVTRGVRECTPDGGARIGGAPAYGFPSWPQWIARIFPTYYIANPIFRISIYEEGWSELGWQVLMLAGFAVLFAVPLLAFASRWGRSSRTGLLTISS